MKKTKDKTESGPTFYQTPNGKFLPSVYASALGRYYFNGGTFDMPRQQMYMPLDVVNANGGPLEEPPTKPMQKGAVENNAADFLTKMIQSPLFNSRYNAMTNKEASAEEVENYRQHMLNNINKVDYWPVGYEYTGKPWSSDAYVANYNRIFDLPKDKYGADIVGNTLEDPNRHNDIDHPHTIFRKDNSPTSTVHELSHASTISDSLPAKVHIPFSKNPEKEISVKKFSSPNYNRSTENKAYLDEVRKYLFDNKIYNATNKVFEDSDYNNLIKTHNNLKLEIEKNPDNTELKYLKEAFDKTIDPYDKEQTIQLFNSYVKNDVPINNTVQYAAHGGYLAPILPMHFDKGTKIFRDTTALPFAHGGKLMDFPAPSLSEREANINYNVYASMPERYYSNGGKFLTAGGEYHRIYKNAEGDIMVNHPAEDKGQWDTINLTNKSGANTIAEGVAATKQWHKENPDSYANGGMIKRADGSYSQRGLWDNIRANKGSGKEPTKEMLAQERKIKADSHAMGGNIIRTSHLFGLGGHKAVFFPTNVSEPGAADKDLTYPKDAYVYAGGGHLYPNGGKICPEGYFFNEETQSCEPILQRQELVPSYKKDFNSPQLTLEELKLQHPDVYNRILQNKSLGDVKNAEEVINEQFASSKKQPKKPNILNPIYWGGLIGSLETDLNNVKYYYAPDSKDDYNYTTVTKIPDLPYSVKVDKNKPEYFDDKTKTLYVPNENNFHYKKFIEHGLLKKEQESLEQDLIKEGYKTDVKRTAETLTNQMYNNIVDKNGKYVLDPYGRFISAKENELPTEHSGSYENMKNVPELFNYDINNPYWLPEKLKNQTYENFYKNRRKENIKRIEGTCPGCGYNHNIEYSYDNDYVYSGDRTTPKTFSLADWKNLKNEDFDKFTEATRLNTISSTKGVSPFPPEVMSVPTEKVLPRNLQVPEPSRNTQWKQNPITGTWYEDESYSNTNKNTPWADERPLGMESYNLNTGTYWTDEDAKRWQQQELKKQAEEAQKKSGQFNTITVPEGFANGGHLFPDGGGLITYKTHGKLINGTGNFNAISKVDISPEYNEQIKHRLYTGKWGFNPETGTLELLKAKDRAVVGQKIQDIRAEEENVKAYNKSIEEAGGIDPRLMHPKTQMSQEELNNFIKEGHKAAVDFLPFKTAAYFTPWGAAAGAIEGGFNLIPDLYKGNYGAAAMDAAATLPFVGPGVRRLAYNAIEPAGYGVLEKLKNAPETFVRSVTNPSGRPLRVGKELVKGAGKEFPEEQLIEMGKNRLDSWRLGLKMPQKYDTFEQIGDNTYRIKNMKPEIGRLSAIDKDIKAYELSKNSNTFEANEAELKKLFAQHDEIANPSKEIGDVNSIRRYLMKSGDINTPSWQQVRIVENSLQPEFTHSVYDIDPQGIMGSHRWDVRKDPTGLLHYQANDTWNLNPFESRGHTKIDEGEFGRKMLSKYHFKPLEKLEALKLIGGKPFKIQNNFAVDPNTFKVINSWKNGGHMPTEKTIIRTSELFK